MKYPVQFKKYIRGHCRELKEHFQFQEWEMFISWEDNDFEKRDAAIDVRPTYLEFTLRIYPQLMKPWKDKNAHEIMTALVHEFSHILTEPLYKVGVDSITNTSKDFLEDIREQQTTKIARIIMKFFREKDWKIT